MNQSMPFIVFRAFVLVEIGLSHKATINVDVTDLSLLGFRLLTVFTPARKGGFLPTTVVAW
jgi:hypothetical protein